MQPGMIMPRMVGYCNEGQSMCDESSHDDFYVYITCYRRRGTSPPAFFEDSNGCGGRPRSPMGTYYDRPTRHMQMPMGMSMMGPPGMFMQQGMIGPGMMGGGGSGADHGSRHDDSERNRADGAADHNPNAVVAADGLQDSVNDCHCEHERQASEPRRIQAHASGGDQSIDMSSMMDGMGMGTGGMSMGGVGPPTVPANKSVVMSQAITKSGPIQLMQQLPCLATMQRSF